MIDLIKYIKTPEGFLVFIGIIIAILGILVPIYLSKKSNNEKSDRKNTLEIEGNASVSTGGRGGNAKASGDNSNAIGGKGGNGGTGGKGGDGGRAEANGSNSFARGGDGGHANGGGQRERSPLSVRI